MFGVVDSLMVGKVGVASLAAASLVTGLFFLIVVLGIGMSLAITPLIAIARGEGKNEKCGIILRQSLIVNSVFSVLLTIITFYLADLIHFLDQPADVAILAESYLKILSFSILPFMLFQTYRQFIEGLSYTKPPMYIVLAANLVNVFGNWILIFGNLGFPALGLDGAGYSTLITRCFMAVLIMWYSFTSPKYKIYDVNLKFKNFNKIIIKKIIRIGLPSGLQYFFEISSFSFAAIMIGWIGRIPLAAHQIAINLASITYMVVLGVSAAATIRVGNAFGRKDFKGLKHAGYIAICYAIIIMGTFGIVFVLFRNFLPTLYISNSEVIQLTASLLIVAAFFQIFDGTQAVGMGILRGLTDVKIPMYISIVAYWIVGIPTAYLLGFNFNLGVVGIWIGLSVGLILAALFFTLRFKYKISKFLSI